MSKAAAYLAATRRQRPAFILRDHYQTFFIDLQSRLAPFGATPEFDLAYSSERTCETITINGQQVVIYDQYLGQTFNQLNRLHLNSLEPREARIYAYKIAAEFAQIDGQPRLAAVLAMAHFANRDSAQTHTKDSDIAHRMRIGALQEAYVMAHEAFHTIIEHQVAWREQMLRDARHDFINNYYLRAISHFENVEHPDRDTILPMYLKQMGLFGNDDALVEECICDTLAMAIICPLPKQQVSISQLKEARDAIFFALRHLRLLAMIRNDVREQRSEHVLDDAWLDPYLIRTQFVGWTLRQFPPLQPLATADQQMQFDAAQARYSTFVEDPVMYELPTFIKGYAERQFPDAHEQELGNKLTDLLLQYPEQARRFEHLGEKFFIIDPNTITQDFYDSRWRELESVMRELETGK